MNEPSEERVEKYYAQLKRDAEKSGYFLNPDVSFVKDIVRGLIVNTDRYGYPSCPCRLASGKKEEDLDIICPCDYRDADVQEHGACYCALYVSQDVFTGKRAASPVPERRTQKGQRPTSPTFSLPSPFTLPYPVYRCNVCGYLCARDTPPDICPICKATKERFSRFL